MGFVENFLVRVIRKTIESDIIGKVFIQDWRSISVLRTTILGVVSSHNDDCGEYTPAIVSLSLPSSKNLKTIECKFNTRFSSV